MIHTNHVAKPAKIRDIQNELLIKSLYDECTTTEINFDLGLKNKKIIGILKALAQKWNSLQLSSSIEKINPFTCQKITYILRHSKQ